MWYLLGELLSSYLFLEWQRAFSLLPVCSLAHCWAALVFQPAQSWVNASVPSCLAWGQWPGEVGRQRENSGSLALLFLSSFCSSSSGLVELQVDAVGMLRGRSLSPEVRKGNLSNSPAQGAFPGKGWDVGGFTGRFHGKWSAACSRNLLNLLLLS